MQDLLKINYETEEPTVSARELYDRLNIKSNFTTWFRRMCEYGFEDGKDFFPKMEESTGGRPSEEFAMKIDMAKEICMLQRSPEGKQLVAILNKIPEEKKGEVIGIVKGYALCAENQRR